MAFFQKITGARGDARTGTLSIDERRSTFATALYAQNRFEISDKWGITPGLRVEAYRQNRDILKSSTDDIHGRTEMIVEWIPGIGTTYQISEDATVFAGVHRGFAPPKFADALSSTGVDQQLESERSWNYELGTKATISGTQFNITGFVYDYQNQIVNAAQSNGFDKANVGKTLTYGAELELGREWNLSQSTTVFGSLVATYVEATQEEGANKGNRLPYSPEHFGSLTTGVRHNAFETALEVVYVGSMFADDVNTKEESLDGLRGEIDSNLVWNLSTQYEFKKVTVFGSVKNIFDATYISSRRPEGIFAGIPRQIQIGVQVNI